MSASPQSSQSSSSSSRSAASPACAATASTPDLAALQAQLPALASRFVAVDELPWRDTPSPKIKMKILLEDPSTGLMTALFRWEPGAQLGDHEHVRIEQSFILAGSIEDEEGVCTAGNFVWRPAGSRHVARSRDGALVLAMFLAPNRFFGNGTAR